MEEYNFEPDYEYWWKRDDLSINELFPLVCGLCPNRYKEWLDAYQPESEIGTKRTPEQVKILEQTQKFYEKRDRAASVEDIMVWLEFFEKENQWDGDKATFLDLFYSYPNAARLNTSYLPSPHTDFICFLKTIEELPEYIEMYNEEYFDIDFTSLNTHEIKDEDTAISVLFGYKIEPFKRWLKFASGNMPVELRTPDDNAFWKACCKHFHCEAYDGGGFLYHLYTQVKALNIKFSSLDLYANKLYNEGVIFQKDVVQFLENKDIKLSYLDGSWAQEFYLPWIEKKLWTLEQASHLFKGQCPKGIPRTFIDLSQSLMHSYGHNWIKCKHTGEFSISIEEHMANSIACDEIEVKRKDEKGKNLFIPRDIVMWFLNNTEHVPPKPLLDLLDISNENHNPNLMHSGMPGRPSSKHLYIIEMKERASRGELCDKVSYEAEALRSWLIKTYPNHSPSTKRAIENNIRDEYRNLKNA